MSEHLRQGLESSDIPVMVGAEHVDEPVEPLGILPSHVRGVGGEVRRRSVGADEDAILLVPVRGCARP